MCDCFEMGIDKQNWLEVKYFFYRLSIEFRICLTDFLISY